jgi:hypothetical protein
VRLNEEPFTVIGVMPPTFAFVRNASLGPPQPADAFIPLNVHLRETNPAAGSYGGLMRARRGAPPETVAAAVNAVGKTVDTRDFTSRGLKLYPVGLQHDLVSGVRPALLVLGLAGAVLVLARMVNLGSVLLARAAQREHEFAVSRALGADGVAVARATLFEGGLLGFAGGIAGSAAASWGTQMLVALAPLTLPRRQAIAVDWSIAGRRHERRHAAGTAGGRSARHLERARQTVVAACEQRSPRRRRSRAHAPQSGRSAGCVVACAAQQRRARGSQLRARPARRPRVQS